MFVVSSLQATSRASITPDHRAPAALPKSAVPLTGVTAAQRSLTGPGAVQQLANSDLDSVEIAPAYFQSRTSHSRPPR